MQNPAAPAVAFFPNALATNLKVKPPQTRGLTFIAHCITVFRDINGFDTISNLGGVPTVQCVDQFDNDSKFGYFVGNFSGPLFGILEIFRVENPASEHPTLVGPIFINVPTTAFSSSAETRSAPHKGNP